MAAEVERSDHHCYMLQKHWGKHFISQKNNEGGGQKKKIKKPCSTGIMISLLNYRFKLTYRIVDPQPGGHSYLEAVCWDSFQRVDSLVVRDIGAAGVKEVK